MSKKQIPLATITMLTLSACCSTLSQGAFATDAPASAPVAVSPANPAPLPPAAPDNKPATEAAVNPAQAAPAATSASAVPVISPVTISKLPVPTKPGLAVAAKRHAPRPLAKVHPTSPERKAAKQPASPTDNLPLYNRPYTNNGMAFVPLPDASKLRQRGEATWYNREKQGQATANGEIYDPYGLTAAHPTLPIPSYARVVNLATGKSIVVRINDRGPFEAGNRKLIELSFNAANKLGLVASANRKVEIVGLESDVPAKPKASISFHLKRERNKDNLPVVSHSKPTVTASGVYLQLGAFRTLASANQYAEKNRPAVTGITPYPLTNLLDGQLYRVRIGPYPSTSAAQQAANALAPTLGFKPLLKTTP